MIRVLQLGMTDNLGGIETFLMNYYRNIDKTKIQFDFINIYPNKLCFQNEIENLGGKVYKVHSYYNHPIKYLNDVIKIINDNDYHIVHCNMNSAAMLYPIIAGKKSNAKIVIAHSHNSSSDKGIIKTIMHNINRHFIPLYANEYFACSEKAGEWFFSKKIRASNKYKIINNAVDMKKYEYNEKIREEKRKELKIKDNAFVIGHVGRFSKQKNHSFLIDTFNKIHNENNNAILLLIGQGPLESKIKEKVNNLNLQDSVIFLGKRLDVNEWYNAMDLFVLTSLYEGLPVVGVEAQSNGLPCIFSDNITREISISKSVEYLPLNETKWVKNISNYYTFERNKNTNISNDFDIKYAAKKLEKIYENMCINKKD